MDRLTARLLDDALAKFTEYFVKNYPGPNTVIHDPKWHAPKIFRAAQLALDAVGQSLSQEAVRDGALREAVKRYLKEQGDESWWTASERRLAITLKRELAEEIERQLYSYSVDSWVDLGLDRESCKQIIAALRRADPVLGECEECGHTIVTPLKRLPERPPSGEMVMVPRPSGMLKPLEVIGARLLARFDNRFGIADPIQFTDNERQVLVAALKILRAALSAAEAEGRKSEK